MSELSHFVKKGSELVRNSKAMVLAVIAIGLAVAVIFARDALEALGAAAYEAEKDYFDDYDD